MASVNVIDFSSLKEEGIFSSMPSELNCAVACNSCAAAELARTEVKVSTSSSPRSGAPAIYKLFLLDVRIGEFIVVRDWNL